MLQWYEVKGIGTLWWDVFFFYVFFPLCIDKPNALSEPRGEEESLTKKGKKKKSVRWAEEEQLKEYFYFDLDETERGKNGIVSLTTL